METIARFHGLGIPPDSSPYQIPCSSLSFDDGSGSFRTRSVAYRGCGLCRQALVANFSSGVSEEHIPAVPVEGFVHCMQQYLLPIVRLHMHPCMHGQPRTPSHKLWVATSPVSFDLCAIEATKTLYIPHPAPC